MGYLINPIGFRVGHTSSWEFSWFAHKDIYPEFLHFILKIRLFFNYILNSMPTIADLDPLNKEVQSLFRSGILYSHFRIKLDFSSLYVDLFFYPGQYWDGTYDSPRLDRRKKKASYDEIFSFTFSKN